MADNEDLENTEQTINDVIADAVKHRFSIEGGNLVVDTTKGATIPPGGRDHTLPTSITGGRVSTPLVDSNRINTDDIIINNQPFTDVSHVTDDNNPEHLVSAYALNQIRLKIKNDVTSIQNQLNNKHITPIISDVITPPYFNTDSNWIHTGVEYSNGQCIYRNDEAFVYTRQAVLKLDPKVFTVPGMYFMVIDVERIDSGELQVLATDNSVIRSITVSGEYFNQIYVEDASNYSLMVTFNNVNQHDRIIIDRIYIYHVQDRAIQYFDYIGQLYTAGDESGIASMSWTSARLAEFRDLMRNDLTAITDSISVSLLTHAGESNPHHTTYLDVDAAASHHTHTPEECESAPEIHTHTPEQCNAAPLVHTHLPSECGAAPEQHTHTPDQCGSAPVVHTHTPGECGAAPLVHTHTATDVGAALTIHTHTPEECGSAPEVHTHTPQQCGAAPTIHTHTADECNAAAVSHTHLPEECGAAAIEHGHTPEECGAAPVSHTHEPAECGAAPELHTHTPGEIGAADRIHTHTAEECNAAAVDHMHTPAQCDAAPANHTHSLEDLTNLTSLTNHLDNTNNPHEVTKAQVGLANVENYGVAEVNDFISGNEIKYATAHGVNQYIDKLFSDDPTLKYVSLAPKKVLSESVVLQPNSNNVFSIALNKNSRYEIIIDCDCANANCLKMSFGRYVVTDESESDSESNNGPNIDTESGSESESSTAAVAGNIDAEYRNSWMMANTISGINHMGWWYSNTNGFYITPKNVGNNILRGRLSIDTTNYNVIGNFQTWLGYYATTDANSSYEKYSNTIYPLCLHGTIGETDSTVASLIISHDSARNDTADTHPLKFTVTVYEFVAVGNNANIIDPTPMLVRQKILGTTVPSGWHKEDGSVLERVKYQELVAYVERDSLYLTHEEYVTRVEADGYCPYFWMGDTHIGLPTMPCEDPLSINIIKTHMKSVG